METVHYLGNKRMVKTVYLNEKSKVNTDQLKHVTTLYNQKYSTKLPLDNLYPIKNILIYNFPFDGWVKINIVHRR